MATTETDDIASGWRKFGVLVLAMAALGLPLNSLPAHALLVVVTVMVCVGTVDLRPRAWLAAVVVVAVSAVGQWLASPPRIEEGHNLFLPEPAVERILPAPVYRAMADVFDAQYPPAVRCEGTTGCWRGSASRIQQAFAFSADSIWHRPAMSRAVDSVDFSDPVWLRLAFVNDRAYNWYTAAPDVHRSDRDKRVYAGLARWTLTMPWYEVITLPPAYVGGQVCWRGDLLWEGDSERFSRWSGESCRPIEAQDVGRRIFGLAIKPASLAMQVIPPWTVRLQLYLKWAFAAAAVIGLVILLVRFRARRTFVPFLLIGLALLVIAIDDASFIGGLRPMDGGDDGLFYDSVGRTLLQRLMAGDIAGFLQGDENVFYYGGPGLRYFRALEHMIFGETYFGYLAVVLAFPFVVRALFRRFLPPPWPLVLALLFVAVPVGAAFGTTFVNYTKWAARGFADPMAYILFTAGLVLLIGASRRFASAFFAALLLALGICMKPIIAPAAAVLLGGAGLAALHQRQWPRLAGMCIGFLPVFSMALHNWVYGHVFVLFSSNAGDANLLTMPPSAWLSAMRELVTFSFGEFFHRAIAQIAGWLSNPAESAWTIPLNAVGVAILVWVVLRGRSFDPWLRLIGAAALAQHVVAFFYNSATARYHFLTWLLTMLVVMVWFHDVGIGWFARRYPAAAQRITTHPAARRLAAAVAQLQKVSA